MTILTDPFTNPDQWQHPTHFSDWNRTEDSEFVNTDVEIRLTPNRGYLVFDKKIGKAARVYNRNLALKLREKRLKEHANNDNSKA